ncbi:MAG TPA: FHA domain-containing protein [Stellaceae bacterium]|nr:FHA domain-containing protein [Stellaceae bacterium]
MDEVIWVEVLTRHRGVQQRYRCTGRGVRIGRAYTNDVILDDPYVAGEHVHIVRDGDDRLVVEDLGSANGLFAAHGRARVPQIVLGEEGIFRIGHTLLRARATDHAVAPERVIGSQTHAWGAIAGLAALVLAIGGGTLWLDDFGEFKAATYVLPLVGGTMLVVLWSALWAMTARIFAGHGRFERNLIIALVGALGLEAVGIASRVGAFGLSWSALVNDTFVGYFAVLAVASVAHLREINPARTLFSCAVVAVVLAGAISVVTLLKGETRFGPGNAYAQTMLPPVLRLAPVANESSFFSSVEKLRGRVDEDRAEAP